MKKTAAALLILAPLSLGLTGCVVAIGDHDRDRNGDHVLSDHDRQYENRKYIAKLMLNTTMSTIQTDLGVPDFSESYDKNGEMVQVLFYRTQRVHKDDLTTRDECTPLIFKQQKLMSWGDRALIQL
ncbi:MAG: DUF3192 domain-containing protein [Gammaproteobacteria bacterium]|nr:DUF3192 domain-containing protein [Gammaproteobacteria bacterium]